MQESFVRLLPLESCKFVALPLQLTDQDRNASPSGDLQARLAQTVWGPSWHLVFWEAEDPRTEAREAGVVFNVHVMVLRRVGKACEGKSLKCV